MVQIHRPGLKHERIGTGTQTGRYGSVSVSFFGVIGRDESVASTFLNILIGYQ